MNAVSGGRIVPVPGGILIFDNEGKLLGAVGVSGDTSDNDEIAAVAGIEASGLKAQVDWSDLGLHRVFELASLPGSYASSSW